MNCDNQCCENHHHHHEYNGGEYGINVNTLVHTNELLLVEQAAELVPVDMRKPGTKITFWTYSGWETWQFVSKDVKEWVLPEHWKQESVYGMDNINDLQNQIDSIQIGGWAISQEFGDDEHIGISQKKLTEEFNKTATLDSNGKVPSYQLPSYVDDVVEGYFYNSAFYADENHTQLLEAETGKIYLDILSKVSYRYSGSSYVAISNPYMPDEEDLTVTNDAIKFKDKAYNAAAYSGYGKKILRKNMVSGVNTLTQSMVNADNTIYVIQYDFDLGEDEIVIPSNCVLKFEGGSLNNGTITGSVTNIDANPIKIFGSDLELSGSWNVTEAYPEWFGVIGDGETDDTALFQKSLNAKFGYYVATNSYVISNTLIVHSTNVLDGKGKGRLTFNTQEESLPCVKLGTGERENNSGLTTIQNIVLSSINRNTGYGIYCYRRSRVKDCKITYFNYGLAITSYSVEVSSCHLTANYVNIGIASAELTIPNPIQQANHIIVRDGIATSSVSGDNIVIGKATDRNPWAAESVDFAEGHLIEVENVALDSGCIYIENIQDVTIRHCYLEGNTVERPTEELARKGTGIYLGNHVSRITIEDNWFHLFDYGIKSLVKEQDYARGVFINNNYFATIYKCCAYLLITPLTFSYRDNYGNATDYLQSHFGFFQMATADVNERLSLVRKNTNQFDGMSYVYLYNEILSLSDSNSETHDFGKCRENYLSYSYQRSITGTYDTNEDYIANVFTLSQNANIKTVIPGAKIQEHDCYVSYIDIDNRKLALYSPTNDYPNITDTTINFQTANGYSISKKVFTDRSQILGLASTYNSGELIFNVKESKLHAKLNSVEDRLYEVPTVACSLFCNATKPENLGLSVQVLFISSGLDITELSLINIAENTIIYYAGGSIYGSGTLNFNNNIIIGVDNIRKMVSSSVTVTGTYYIGYKPVSGSSSSRPTNATMGIQYFDSTIGKPIWYNGTNWVDSTGTQV